MCSGDAPCSLRREYPRAFTGGASVMRHTLLHLTAKGSGIRPCRRWLPPVRVGLPNRRRWCHRGAPPQRTLERGVPGMYRVGMGVSGDRHPVDAPRVWPGLCPGERLVTGGISRGIGLLCLLGSAHGSFAAGYLLNRRLPHRGDADTTSGSKPRAFWDTGMALLGCGVGTVSPRGVCMTSSITRWAGRWAGPNRGRAPLAAPARSAMPARVEVSCSSMPLPNSRGDAT